MNDFDWVQWGIVSAMGMAASGGGAWAGFQGGKAGKSLRRILFAAAGRGAFCVFVLSLVTATVIAHYELRELGRPLGRPMTHMLSPYPLSGMDEGPRQYITWADDQGLSGLELDQEGWLAAHYDGHGLGVQCGECRGRIYYNPSEVTRLAMAKGAIWAFVAPVFCLIGTIPAMITATMAFNFGARKRLAAEVWREQSR